MSKSRHPNQFRVGRAASPNILTLGGNMPRAIAKTHANQLAAWLVSTANEPEKFMEVLIDVYAEKHGVKNIPAWLKALCPDWKPWEPPPLRPKGSTENPATRAAADAEARSAMNKRAKKAGPIKTASQAVREAGASAGASRFLGEDGKPLDNEALLRQAEEAEAILKGEKPAPQLRNGNGGSDEEEEDPSDGDEEETEEEETEEETDDAQDGEGGGQ